MKTELIAGRQLPFGNLAAFSLVELLVVIAIIGILAGLVLSAIIGAVPEKGKSITRLEMANLKGAIIKYESEYSIYPTTSTNSGANITYGGSGIGLAGPGNADIIDILRNVEPANRTSGQGHPRNPRHIPYIEIKPASTPTSSGVTTDGEYNDPWGNPYIITMDNNYSGFVSDPITGQRVNAGVLIWSRGPDGKASTTASHPDNKDNVLGWK